MKYNNYIVVYLHFDHIIHFIELRTLGQMQRNLKNSLIKRQLEILKFK